MLICWGFRRSSFCILIYHLMYLSQTVISLIAFLALMFLLSIYCLFYWMLFWIWQFLKRVKLVIYWQKLWEFQQTSIFTQIKCFTKFVSKTDFSQKNPQILKIVEVPGIREKTLTSTNAIILLSRRSSQFENNNVSYLFFRTIIII